MHTALLGKPVPDLSHHTYMSYAFSIPLITSIKNIFFCLLYIVYTIIIYIILVVSFPPYFHTLSIAQNYQITAQA